MPNSANARRALPPSCPAWDWNEASGDCLWDDGQYRIFGVERQNFVVSAENVRALIHPDDWDSLQSAVEKLFKEFEKAKKAEDARRKAEVVRGVMRRSLRSANRRHRIGYCN